MFIVVYIAHFSHCFLIVLGTGSDTQSWKKNLCILEGKGSESLKTRV